MSSKLTVQLPIKSDASLAPTNYKCMCIWVMVLDLEVDNIY
jgi:hypothetical protein